MKVGDLVKVKWVTYAEFRRAQRFGNAGGKNPDSVGIIVEVSPLRIIPSFKAVVQEGVAKVMFPETGIKSYLVDSLEVIEEK